MNPVAGSGPFSATPKVKPQEAGAWYGYLRTTRGFAKKVWWTKEQIHEHAKRFSRSYNSPKSLWKNPNQVHTMEMKTVLRDLLNWADKSGYGDPHLREALKASDEAAEVVDVEASDVPEAEKVTESVPAEGPELHQMSVQEARETIVVGSSGSERFLGELSSETLNKIYLSDKYTPEQKQAVTIVLKEDFSMDPPQKRKPEDVIKELQS